MKSLIRSIAIVAILGLASAPACATSNYDYGKDEYVVIDGGLSPDKRLSLAAHGEGEGGNDNFHVWLMQEPAHSKIAALDDISSDNNLDTGADAYHAFWSADSRRVAVFFRSDRHVVQPNLYAIEDRTAHLISGPSLFRHVTGRDVDEDADLRRSVPEIEWRGSQRFLLKEYRLFKADDAALARALGIYGKKTRLDDGKYMVEFSAEADCVLEPGNRYRVVKLKRGKFDKPD